MITVDRFEGTSVFLCDDQGNVFTLPRNMVPLYAQEGDILRITAVLDRRQSALQRRAAKAALKGFFNK